MQDRESLRRTLVDLLEADTGVQYPTLDDTTKLREGLGLDSVDVVSLVSQIERQFKIRLSHQELEALVTVGDLLSLLQVKIQNPDQSKNAA
jgi:acyl carrier protein